MTAAQSFHLTSENIRHNCFDFIADVPVDEGYLVTIKKASEKRTAAQSRLRWVWMGFLEKELIGEGVGRSKEDWNRYFKGKFLRGLLIAQDDEHANFYHDADRLLSGANDKSFAKRVLLDNVRTEWLTTKNMSEFMGSIDKHCAYKLKINLPLPNDLKYLCEGGVWT